MIYRTDKETVVQTGTINGCAYTAVAKFRGNEDDAMTQAKAAIRSALCDHFALFRGPKSDEKDALVVIPGSPSVSLHYRYDYNTQGE
jgi:hypothetical protein